MTDTKQRNLILKAYIDKFEAYPKYPQQLISFTKKSKDFSNINLRYSEARKIINNSRSQLTKNSLTTKYKISPKKTRKTKKTNYKISPKKKKKKKSKREKTPQNGNSLINSTTKPTPNIDAIQTADELTPKNKQKEYNFKKKHEQHHLDYTVGDRVLLTQDREGLIKYIGSVSFVDGTMYGIELLNGAVGKHNGTVQNKRYFNAPKQRGIFVKKTRIRRKIRQKERRSSNQLNREAALIKLRDRKSKSPKTPTEKRWKPPYTIYKSLSPSLSPTSSWKSEKSYIYRPHSPMSPNKDTIDASSMSIMYTKASKNLHRHILQKVNQVKIRNDIRNKVFNTISLNPMNKAFNASKLHSPMTPIHILPETKDTEPIITSEAVTTERMRKMVKKNRRKKKKTSLIIHKKPSIKKAKMPSLKKKFTPKQIITVIDPIKDDEKESFNNISVVAEVDEEKLNVIASPITFSPRDATFSDLLSPVTSTVPPLTQVTINYIEMEQKVDHLIDLLIKKKDKIEDGYVLYNECDITDNDLNEELFAWVDLLCTHSKLFATTARVKDVKRDNCFFSTKEGDDNVYKEEEEEEEEEDDDTEASTPSESEKEKESLRKKNAKMMRNNKEYFDDNSVYYYTAFERLLFELDFFYLYFIYDIGLDNSNAFNEQHPSVLFLLSGNMSQLLKKCSPVLYSDIDIFRRDILDPFHLKIRYKSLNNDDKWNTISMIKYEEEDGIRNDYNFVGRIQYEEMIDNNNNDDDNDDNDDTPMNEEEMVDDLEYEIIVYHKRKKKAMAIYKSVIPSVFTINYQLKITNLKRTIMCPSLILNRVCHIECEKWNEEGDYYGFIRINIVNNFIINCDSMISATECGYYKQNGFGVGSFKNDSRNKTKYYSGGSYGTASESPHELCPAGSIYGEDCICNNYLYYGSPCFDDNERGGGIIDILCGKTLINHGSICCNGANGMQFGGSSGGSIKIIAMNFINYGSITANGGKGAIYQRKGSKRKQIGTDGGDGRIFIICKKFINKGIIEPKPIIIKIESIKEINTKYKLSHIKSLSEETMF